MTCVYAEVDFDTKSGTPGSESRKVKGNIHWLSAAHAVAAEVRLYDRLFAVPAPGSRHEGDPAELERNFLDDINPNSKASTRVMLESSLAKAAPESSYQFERHGYFVADIKDHSAEHPVYNRTVTLRDAWSK